MKNSPWRTKFFTARVATRDLAFGHAQFEFRTETQTLADNRLKAIRQSRSNTALTFRRKRRHNALEGLGSSRGVHRAEDKMTRFRRVQSEPHGGRFPHLAHHQHVRILAQSVQQRLLEGRGVPAHLALADEGTTRPERVLDRTLNGDNVPGLGQVDLLDQRGQSRRLAAPGRSTDEDQPMLQPREPPKIRMQVQTIDRRSEGSQQANRKPDPPRAVQHVDATAHSRNRLGRVKRTLLQKRRPVPLPDQFARRVRQVLGGHRAPLNQQRAVDPERRRQARLKVQVAGAPRFGRRDHVSQCHTVTS